jgi:hypothetical protein
VRVSWWVAWPCNLIGVVAIGLLILDPDGKLPDDGGCVVREAVARYLRKK